MLIVTTETPDVYRNLAMEEWLLDHAPALPVLVLYVNSPAVVVGKNQNPWRECRLSLMKDEGVPLARRISGGGAVYHDEGNLNVGVIVPRVQYQEEKQYEFVLETLKRFDVTASRLGKSSLAVDGRKFSGQAFCFRRDRVLHHGTLLVNSDLKRLGRYLGPEIDGIETKAVASVPAKVANLSAFASGLTVEALSSALIETFREMYAGCGIRDTGYGMRDAGCVEEWTDADVEKCAGTQFLPMIGKLSSNGWKFCHTPRFTVERNGKFLEVEKGRVTNLKRMPLFADLMF